MPALHLLLALSRAISLEVTLRPVPTHQPPQVTDMAPKANGVMNDRHATWVGPPLDEEDGAARVLDPIFSHLKDRTWRIRGHCFRNYYIAGW